MIANYKIGVHLAATNGVSGVLSVIARDLLGVHGHVNNDTAAMGRMKVAIGGVASIMGGVAVLGVFKSLAEAAKEFRIEQSRLAGAGFTPQQSDAAVLQAKNVALNIPGANAAETLRHIRESNEILGSAKSATDVAPIVEKLALALHNQTGMETESAMKFLSKAVEIQAQEKLFDKDGKFDKDNFKDRMDAAYRFLVASNGFIPATSLNTMLQQSGVAAQMQDYKKFWPNMLMMGIEQGGARAGTGLAADYRTINSGIVGKDRQAAWVGAGLMHYEGSGKSRKSVLNADGQKIIDGPGGVQEYVETKMVPALLKKLHFKTLEEHGAMEALRAWIQKNESVETARRSLSAMINKVGMDKARENYARTPGFEATYDHLMANNPEMQMHAFEEALKNLKRTLGDPMWDPAIGVVNKLTLQLNKLAKLAQDHPESVETLEKVALAIAAVMTLGGAVALGSVTLGPLVAALAALAAPALGLVAVAAGIVALAAAIPGLGEAVKGLLADLTPADLSKGVVGWLGMVGNVAYGDNGLITNPAGAARNAWEGFTHRQTADEQTADRRKRHPEEFSADGTWSGPGNNSPGGSAAKPIIQTVINLDGKEIARSTSAYQAQDLGKPPSSGPNFNFRASPAYPSQVN